MSMARAGLIIPASRSAIRALANTFRHLLKCLYR